MKNVFILLILMLITKVSFATDLESNCINLKEFGNLISVRIDVEQRDFEKSRVPLSGYFNIHMGRDCSWDGLNHLGKIKFDLEVFQYVNRVKIQRVWFERENEVEPEFSLLNQVIDIALGMARDIEFTYDKGKLNFNQLVLHEAVLGKNQYRFKFNDY
ncbi:hypothetical protein N9N67_05805 [Bacteriovoracaceae bacterium]|nr:hypothetical protein [Bacteriovoracaceae bacterium]